MSNRSGGLTEAGAFVVLLPILAVCVVLGAVVGVCIQLAVWGIQRMLKCRGGSAA